MKLHLWNGSKTKKAWDMTSPEFIDDFKPEEAFIQCDAVQVTYGMHIKVHLKQKRILELFWDDDLVEHEGVFYGDFTVGDEDEEIS